MLQTSDFAVFPFQVLEKSNLLVDWTKEVLSEPLNDAVFMENMLTSQLNKLFIDFEVSQTNNATIKLICYRKSPVFPDRLILVSGIVSPVSLKVGGLNLAIIKRIHTLP